ncbi:hypothetical protein [Microbacterium sp. CJ88]|uniref:hypothetical protein n=1 Tax=Microbacterium sp. CJ88 TaxID=3445672 RepID=UPI003F65C7EE
MRWDRFFEDLEDQLASEWEAERAALDTEAERLRLARVAMRERLRALAEREPSVAPSFELADGTVEVAPVTGVGADWVGLAPAGPPGAMIVPLAAIVAIGMPHAELLRSARADGGAASTLGDRMTLGFVLRDVSRRRLPVTVSLRGGRVLTGTIDRAGADHLDLALHDPGAARRADAVSGHRMVPFDAIVRVRVDAPVALL